MTNYIEIAWARSVPEPNTGCWLWLGYADRKGYARLSLGRGRKMGMGRLILGLGPLIGRVKATSILACHRCDTPLCVNPDHLFAATHAMNMLDMRLKKRKDRSHCLRGHEMRGDNLFWQLRTNGSDSRACLACLRIRTRARTYKKHQGGGSEHV